MIKFATSIRPRRRTLLAGATVLNAACSLGGLARAEDAKIEQAVFDAQSTFFAAIVKVENDGEKWTKVLPGNVGFDAHMKVDTKWPGYVEHIGVWLSECNGTGCGAYPRILHEVPLQRDYNVNRSLSFPVEKLLEARSGAVSYRDMIINRCNSKPATAPHGFMMAIDATFSANTRKAAREGGFAPVEVGEAFGGGDVTRHDTFEISVDCLGPPRETTGRNGEPEPQRVKPVATKDIDLFLTTVIPPPSAQHGPSGTQCKPLKVTTRIETDKAGPVPVKLWRQVNGGPITSEPKQMTAEALGGGQFGDDWVKVEHFTKTTTVQYKAETFGGTFAPSTPWKSITIHCNGDYAPTPNTSNPDNGFPPRGQPKAELPPAIVTPPPACGSKAAKLGGSATCIKTAQLPDQRKDLAEQKRREAAKREAARQAQWRRDAAREIAMQRQINANATMRPSLGMHRPHPFGRPIGPTTPGRARAKLGVGIMYTR